MSSAPDPSPSAGAPLTGKERRRLRALAHHLDPVLRIGHRGVTDGVTRELSAALTHHQLLKIRCEEEAPDRPKVLAAELARSTGAHLVQTLGRTAVLYRRNPEQPDLLGPKEATS